MSYSIFIESDHVYVKYSEVIDTLDMIRLVKDDLFINNIRVLQNLIHDFSNCEEVTVTLEDMNDIALMANIESNFTENLVEVIIPIKTDVQEGKEKVEALRKAVKSPDWIIIFAKNYESALEKIA